MDKLVEDLIKLEQEVDRRHDWILSYLEYTAVRRQKISNLVAWVAFCCFLYAVADVIGEHYYSKTQVDLEQRIEHLEMLLGVPESETLQPLLEDSP